MVPQQPQTNQRTIGTHAIVIGGSMAGLLAARVLTDHFEKVTLVERDRLPERPENRKGVPQGQHVHGLLAKGLEIMSHLFPDLINWYVSKVHRASTHDPDVYRPARTTAQEDRVMHWEVKGCWCVNNKRWKRASTSTDSCNLSGLSVRSSSRW